MSNTKKHRPKKSKKCHCKYRPKRTKNSTNLNIQRVSEYIDYGKINDYLNNLLQNYPNNIQIEVIGYSKEQRPIFLVFISNEASENPKNSIFIEAGSCGEDFIAVASILYIIKYLCKNASTSTILKSMDLFIIPCTNPDAYQQALNGKKPLINLTTSFPFKLGQCNIEDIGMDKFLEAAKKWKENYEFDNPERVILVRAIASYQFCVKLFISLQEEGEKIVYPFGMTKQVLIDIDELSRVAKFGKSGSQIYLETGTIYQQCGLKFGTIIDFLRMFSNCLKFTYIIHINDKKKRQKFSDVPNRAENLLCCITLMAKKVFEYYNVEKKDVAPTKKIKFINKK